MSSHARSHLRIAAAIAWTFALAAPLARSQPESRPAESPTAELPTWTLVYVMSYDNDLSPIGDGILDALESAASAHVRVTVLADLVGPDGLRHIAMDANGRSVETLTTDDSASEDNLAAYLDWATQHFPADRYAIVFLNHGGRLDEMALDAAPHATPRDRETDASTTDSPTTGSSTTNAPIANTPSTNDGRWLSARRVGPMLADLQRRLDGAIELVFLQQCGRGSIENLYNFRGAARALLASPTYVGIPNTYYAPVLEWLARHRDTDGFELAHAIAEHDTHFASYACVRTAQLDALPHHLDAVVDEVQRATSRDFPALAPDTHCFGPFHGESRFDLLAWWHALYESREIAPNRDSAITNFEAWIENDLLAFHRRHPDYFAATRNWCGLSLYVPPPTGLAPAYTDYPLYAASRLDELWTPAPK